MSIMRYRGLMVLVLWQTVPAPVAFDSAGRVQGVLGFGGGQYEQVRTDCNGETVGRSPVGFTSVGAQVDAWINESIRVSGFAGSIDADSARWDGEYYGVIGALELQRLGVGLGAVKTPDGGRPSLYLRGGNYDKLHVLFDFSGPSPPLGTGGAARFGLGYHRGRLRGFGAFGGISLCHARCDGNSNPALFADVTLPVVGPFDLELRGLAGSGKDYDNTGIAVAGRVHLFR